MKIKKHFFNLLVYDISNWGFNLAAVLFAWTINHTFTLILTALFFLRFGANYTYRWSILKEEAQYKKQMMDQMNSFAKKMQEEEARVKAHNDNLLVVREVTDEEIFEPTPIKKDILQ